MVTLVPPNAGKARLWCGLHVKNCHRYGYLDISQMAAPTPQTTLKSRATEAARTILQDHLSLQGAETVALFHDERGVAVANCLSDAARYLRIRVVTRYIPADKQTTLTREDHALLEQADATLTCFTETLKSIAFRRHLIDQAAADQRVLGSLSPSLHALAQSAGRASADDAIRCDDLAQILLCGESAEVVTAVRDARGSIIEEHRLHLSLGGPQRAPVTACGPIHAGTWARLPSPEVCIAPLEDSAHGVFVLNGAFPGGVLSGQEHLLLIFTAGRLEMVGGNSPRVGEFWRIVESAKSAGGPPLALSELGLRLWDLSPEATPHALLPLGLGDNTALGGNLRSPLQELLLTRQASLLVDGHPVLQDGHFVYDASHWRESRDTIHQLGQTLAANCEIRLTPNHAAPDATGRLRVLRPVGHKRICAYRPGDAATGERLAGLYLALGEQRATITLPALAQQLIPSRLCANLDDLRGLLGILHHHRLIEIREPMDLAWDGHGSRLGV